MCLYKKLFSREPEDKLLKLISISLPESPIGKPGEVVQYNLSDGSKILILSYPERTKRLFNL